VVFFTVRSTSIELLRAFQVFRIAVAEADQVVVAASHIKAVQHLGLVAHGLLKGLEHAVVHRLQVDDGKAGAVLAQGLGIEQGHVLADHARFFELFDPAQTGRR